MRHVKIQTDFCDLRVNCVQIEHSHFVCNKRSQMVYFCVEILLLKKQLTLAQVIHLAHYLWRFYLAFTHSYPNLNTSKNAKATLFPPSSIGRCFVCFFRSLFDSVCGFLVDASNHFSYAQFRFGWMVIVWARNERVYRFHQAKIECKRLFFSSKRQTIRSLLLRTSKLSSTWNSWCVLQTVNCFNFLRLAFVFCHHGALFKTTIFRDFSKLEIMDDSRKISCTFKCLVCIAATTFHVGIS